MPPGIETSGGSAANTMAGVASLGGRSTYIGKVRDDQRGEVFAHDTRNGGVGFDVPFATEGEPTARSLIQVTPDGERTMVTFLGISALNPGDIDREIVESAAITYCEGYLWDRDEAKGAIRHAMTIASDAERIVSLTLSDSFCVDRHRDEWMDLLDDRVDLVFANDAEVCSMFETDDFDAAAGRLRTWWGCGADPKCRGVGRACKRRAVRCSRRARRARGRCHNCGDLFARFIYGLSLGASLERCAELGDRR